MFLNLESLLVEAAAPTGSIDVPTLASLHEMYGDEIDMDALEVEANIFRAIMSNWRVGCSKDTYNKIKTCPGKLKGTSAEHYAHNKADFLSTQEPLVL